MQCNKNTMNTRVIKGNQFTQDMMIDPRQFVMGEREFNYKEVSPMQQIQPLPPMQPLPPQQNMPCGCNPQGPGNQVCNEVCEPVTVTDSTYTSCATVNCESGSSNNCCDNSIVPPPITAANSMTRLIAGYQVSDMIKFDRVATSATPVLAAGALTSPTVTVTGAPLNPGTYRFKVKEVCFGDLNLAINTGAPTLGGVALTPTNVFNTTYTRLVRSPINLPASLQCCKQCLGTTLEYNQPTLSATVSSPTAANSMTRLIAGYQVSDMIKFDRVATSATPVLAAGALTSPTVTVTGAPLNPGTYRFKVKEVCFGDLNLAINTGAPTLGGVALTPTNVFNTTYTRLVRSPINLPASLQCCKQCLGTTLEYNQPTLSATVSSPTAPTTETIPVLLRGKCGCTNIEVRTTINVQTNISFTFDSLKGALCRRPNLTPVLADQYYQAKLTLGCINATITAPTVAGGAYTIRIVDPVYANLVMRLTVSLLSYGTMAVLSTIEPVQARDIPVQTANFDFDSCLQ